MWQRAPHYPAKNGNADAAGQPKIEVDKCSIFLLNGLATEQCAVPCWMYRTAVGLKSLVRPFRHPSIPSIPPQNSNRISIMLSNASTAGADASRQFSTFTNPLETQSTVIIGAGIVGCSAAYYLATSGNTKADTIHLIEASPELFASASGKAAGFLASDCKLCRE